METQDVRRGLNHQYSAPALAFGLQILELFGEGRDRMRLSEIAREIGISRSSAFRLIYTLQSLGYLERDDETKSYRLGARTLSLGYAFLASKDVVEAAQPILEQLRDRTDNSAHLGILDGKDVVYVARMASHKRVSTNIRVGTRLPSYATTMGRMLLAFRPEGELRRLLGRTKFERFSPRTPGTFDELLAQLAVDRTHCFAISHSSFEAGIASVAAPVFGGTGTVVAAINVSGPDGIVTRQVFDSTVRDAVCAAARMISERLGYRPMQRESPP
jgi:DNA-binding IclR family transcriptional regulator